MVTEWRLASGCSLGLQKEGKAADEEEEEEKGEEEEVVLAAGVTTYLHSAALAKKKKKTTKKQTLSNQFRLVSSFSSRCISFCLIGNLKIFIEPLQIIPLVSKRRLQKGQIIPALS